MLGGTRGEQRHRVGGGGQRSWKRNNTALKQTEEREIIDTGGRKSS